MTKIYDIDAALNDRPVVRLRGVEYLVADHTVADRVRITRETIALREQMAERQEAGDDIGEALTKLQGAAVRSMLEGVPDEVADALSEREFEAITFAVAEIRNAGVAVVGTEKND